MTRVRAFQVAVLAYFSLELASRFRLFGDWLLTDARGTRILEYDGYASLLNGQSPIFTTVPFLVLAFATVGLVFLRNWGRYLFLGLLGWGVISSPLFGVTVYSPFDQLLGVGSAILAGVILALAFWSPLAQAFHGRGSNESSAP
jgi:hypothetical protein